jgi:hypothetical protein
VSETGRTALMLLPSQLAEPPWAVRVEGLPDDGADEGFVVVDFYGPYTELQARHVAHTLNRAPVRARERIAVAHPIPMRRYPRLRKDAR